MEKAPPNFFHRRRRIIKAPNCRREYELPDSLWLNRRIGGRRCRLITLTTFLAKSVATATAIVIRLAFLHQLFELCLLFGSEYRRNLRLSVFHRGLHLFMKSLCASLFLCRERSLE